MKVELTFLLPTDQPTADRGKQSIMSKGAQSRTKKPAPPLAAKGPSTSLPCRHLTATRSLLQTEPPKPARERETAPPPTTTVTATPAPTVVRHVMKQMPSPTAPPPPLKLLRCSTPTQTSPKQTAPAEPTSQPEPTPIPTAASDLSKQPPRKQWEGTTYQTRPHRHQHRDIIYYWKLISYAKYRHDNGTYALVIQLRGKTDEKSYLTFNQATTVREEEYLLLYPVTPKYKQAALYYHLTIGNMRSNDCDYLNALNNNEVLELRPPEAASAPNLSFNTPGGRPIPTRPKKKK